MLYKPASRQQTFRPPRVTFASSSQPQKPTDMQQQCYNTIQSSEERCGDATKRWHTQFRNGRKKWPFQVCPPSKSSVLVQRHRFRLRPYACPAGQIAAHTYMYMHREHSSSRLSGCMRAGCMCDMCARTARFKGFSRPRGRFIAMPVRCICIHGRIRMRVHALSSCAACCSVSNS